MKIENTAEEALILNNNGIDIKVYCSLEKFDVVEKNKFMKTGEITLRRHTRYIDFPPHRHDYIELLYVYSGKLKHSINQNEFIIQQGDFFIMNQAVYHSISSSSTNDIVFNFIIAPSYLKKLLKFSNNNLTFDKFIGKCTYNIDHHIAEYIHFSNLNKTVINFANNLVEKFIKNDNNDTTELQLEMGILLYKLIDDKSKYNIYSYNSYDDIIASNVHKYIRDNYANATINELSCQLNIATYTLSKFIKKYFNQTFQSLLQEEKLTNAAKLLESALFSNEQISEIIGYHSLSHFYKAFKLKYKCTPSQYRKYEHLEKCIVWPH